MACDTGLWTLTKGDVQRYSHFGSAPNACYAERSLPAIDLCRRQYRCFHHPRRHPHPLRRFYASFALADVVVAAYSGMIGKAFAADPPQTRMSRKRLRLRQILKNLRMHCSDVCTGYIYFEK